MIQRRVGIESRPGQRAEGLLLAAYAPMARSESLIWKMSVDSG